MGKSGEFFSQNGWRRPFWMTENNFRSHFSPFQINAQLFYFFNFFTKWPPAAILDDRKSLWIAVFAISDQYPTFFFDFFSKWPPGHFGSRFFPKSIGTYLYSRSVATTNTILVFSLSPKSIGFFHSRSSMAVSYMNLIRALVTQLRETQALVCGGCGGGGCGGGGGGGGVQTKTIISPKF